MAYRLTLEELQEIQADAMADDIEIDFKRMSLWSKSDATTFFESGGLQDPDVWKAWFPYWQARDEPPSLRIVCLHPMGSSSNYWYPTSGPTNPIKSARKNPFLENASWLEVLAPELPGRMARREEPFITDMRQVTDAIATILLPILTDGTPYVLAGHSMGTWVAYDLLNNLAARGVPPPVGFFANCFPAPHLPKEKHGVGAAVPPPLAADGTLDEATIEGCLAWGAPQMAFRTDQLSRWWPTHRADGSILASFEFPFDRSAPPRLPCPLWATRASEDRGAFPEDVAGWEALSPTHDGKAKRPPDECLAPFELLLLDGAHHLYMKDDHFRVQWMTWALRKLRALAGVEED